MGFYFFIYPNKFVTFIMNYYFNLIYLKLLIRYFLMKMIDFYL